MNISKHSEEMEPETMNLIQKRKRNIMKWSITLTCALILAAIGPMTGARVGAIQLFLILGGVIAISNKMSKEIFPDVKESDNENVQLYVQDENGPKCPECQNVNSYFDHKGNIFCRDCMRITAKSK